MRPINWGYLGIGVSISTLFFLILSDRVWGQGVDPSSSEQAQDGDLQVIPTGTTSVMDLIPLNPDPKVLDVPKVPEEVTIDTHQPITLQQALDLARRNNRDLQVIELELRQSQAALREAQAANLPTISAQGSLTRTDSATARIAINQQEEATGFPIPGASSVSNIFSTSAQVSYDVFTSGQRSASIRAAQAAATAAAQSLETELQQLRLDVTNDYYDMQESDELVKIAQAAVSNAEVSLQDARLLQQAGLGTRFDVLRAEVQLSDRQQDLTNALSQQKIARRQLAERLSLDQSSNLSAADPVDLAGQWPLSLEDSIAQAIQNRSELGELLSQRQIALENRRLAKASFGPQVSVSASVTFAEDLEDGVSGEFGNSVGGQVTKLIFDGGGTKAIADQQQANVEIAQTQFANFKNLIRFQVEQNYFTLQSSFRNIQTNRQAVGEARESLRLARLRFKSGLGTQLEVNNAETDLTRAQSNLLTSFLDYNRALVALDRFVGRRSTP
jgi:OMF family outer membrane factor